MNKQFARQVIIEPDETGGDNVGCPSLPGCFSEGDDKVVPYNHLGRFLE